MRQFISKTIRSSIAGIALLASCATNAWAGPADLANASRTAPEHAAAVTASPQQAPLASAKTDSQGDFGPVADVAKLSQARGGADTSTTTNTSNLSGIVSNNNATNVVTGNNVIDAGSFANMSGIPVVIQNTGANVLIQSSTIVNVQFK